MQNSNNSRMKVAIIGAGGVGGYFGGRLALAGYDVTFLARGEHLKAIKQNGLTIKSIHSNYKLASVKATDCIKSIGLVDFIILAVKAWQIKDISKNLLDIVHDGTIILPLQNGVLVADELKKNIKEENLIAGLCRIISKIESPGVIKNYGIEPTILLGELDNSKTERLTLVKSMFDKAGINANISDDIISDLWKIFMCICVSGLLAVSNTTYGELRELKETRQLMVELLTEIYTLAQKIGVQIEYGFISEAMDFIDSFPFGSTSSLTRDVWQGKPSEIEYQNGTVVRLADKYGVDVPINRFVYNCILPMNKKAQNRLTQSANVCV